MAKRSGPSSRVKLPPPSELREWLNVAVAAAALVLSLVSFWTTARISGIEDYLRSEISRRNGELQIAEGRSRQLEISAENRRSAVESLQVEANRLLATAATNERRISESESKLLSLRTDITNANIKARELEGESRLVSKTSAEQRRNLEILYRRQVYEAMSSKVSPITYNIRFLVDQGDPGTGQQAYDTIMTKEPEGGSQVSSRLHIMRENLPRVCPAMRDIKYVDGGRPVAPASPNMSVDGFKTQQAYNDALKIRVEKWKSDYSEYEKLLDAYHKKRSNFAESFSGDVRRCICASLADSDISSSEICPGV